jgi:hypothetical protein
MGKVGDVLFGKKPKPGKSESESGNHAWPAINSAMSPALGYVTGGGNMMGSLLGIPGMGDQTQALDNFANAGGMKWMMDQGNRMINSNQAAKGLLNSGSTLTGIQKYGQGLGSTYLNQMFSHLNDFSRLGLGAGGLMASAGGWSKSKGTGDNPGKKGIAPDLLAAAATMSDPRLKTNVEKIGEFEDGLDIYEYEYIPTMDLPEGRQVGVMADEVKELRPWAYVPNFIGEFAGVDYAKLGDFPNG